MSEDTNNLFQRLVASFISVILVSFAIIFSYTPYLSLVFLLLTLFIVSLSLNEFYAITKRKTSEPNAFLTQMLSALYLLTLFLFPKKSAFSVFSLLFLALLSIFPAYFTKQKQALKNIAVTLFGLLYLTIPLGFIILINYYFPGHALQDGRWWLGFLLTMTYMTDTSALFVGKGFGKRPLAPSISPKKTWEGAIGAFLITIFTSIGFHYLVKKMDAPLQINILESILLGGVLSLLAQIGDLSESLLKRDAEMKDSAKLPGLGGMLDVLDSLIYTAPFLYLYLLYHYPDYAGICP